MGEHGHVHGHASTNGTGNKAATCGRSSCRIWGAREGRGEGRGGEGRGGEGRGGEGRGEERGGSWMPAFPAPVPLKQICKAVFEPSQNGQCVEPCPQFRSMNTILALPAPNRAGCRLYNRWNPSLISASAPGNVGLSLVMMTPEQKNKEPKIRASAALKKRNPKGQPEPNSICSLQWPPPELASSLPGYMWGIMGAYWYLGEWTSSSRCLASATSVCA